MSELIRAGEGGFRPEDYITDWYLPDQNALKGFFYPNAVVIEDHPRLFTLVSNLVKKCREKTHDGSVEFVVREANRSYRGHVIETIEGKYYALRRLPDTLPSLEKLGIEPAIQQILMHPELSKGGLILICGETGQGKSTTCAATIKDRMEKLGAFCLTVEDPPEMPLHGHHGAGRCLQTEVRNGEWAEAMRGAMRCYPTVSGSMLYVGETRDAPAAAEVLRIALNGHLVLTTIHADNIENAVKRFMSMAQAAPMPENEVKQIMASCFRLCLHQELKKIPATSTEPERRKLKINFLFSPNVRSPVAQQLKNKEGCSLNNEIQIQQMTLKNQGADAIMKMFKM